MQEQGRRCHFIGMHRCRSIPIFFSICPWLPANVPQSYIVIEAHCVLRCPIEYTRSEGGCFETVCFCDGGSTENSAIAPATYGHMLIINPILFDQHIHTTHQIFIV